MKKLLTAFACFACIAVFADTELNVHNFLPAKGGKSEIIPMFWKTKGLQVTADKNSDAFITYNQFFTYQGNVVYEVTADIEGTGTPIVMFQFYTLEGEVCGKPMYAKVAINEDGDEMEAILDLRQVKFPAQPRRFKVTIGVPKGNSMLFDDVELDFDDDDD